MIKYVIFDVFETLVTLCNQPCSYFGLEIAQDMGVPWEQFCGPWRATDPDRTLGKVSFEEVIRNLMDEFGCFSEETHSMIVRKRYEHKKYSFEVMREDILTMLEQLQQEGCKVGLLSNCYFEEQKFIRGSRIMDYLDTAVLSCEVGMAKPDENVFRLCMRNLWQGAEDIDPSQFLYVGDGGSRELETASKLGMTACQAVWYLLQDNEIQLAERKPEFDAFYEPMEVVEFVRKN